MSDVVVRVLGVSKKFCRRLRHSMAYGVQDVARGMLGLGAGPSGLRPGEFWAVHEASLELRRGETLGLIGPNGSGKSTLLRLLNGIYPPDCGRIEIRGRVGALISVGAGFHPLMTGRENIYLNGAILGMSRREMDRKFESIVEFADIGEALDAPVKTYSSGMYVRLGFSVAIHCEPDILLVDEILAVGDTAFRNKCMARLRELREDGTAVILVSHNLDAIRFMSHRVLAMEDGAVADCGEPAAVIAGYEQRTFSKELLARAPEGCGRRVESSGDIRVESARVLGVGASGPARLKCGQEVAVEFVLSSKRRIESPLFSVGILNAAGVVCVWNVSAEDGFAPPPLEGRQRLVARFDGVRLSPGSYEVNLSVRDKRTMETLERLRSTAGFCVEGDSKSRGIVRGSCAWAVEPL